MNQFVLRKYLLGIALLLSAVFCSFPARATSGAGPMDIDLKLGVILGAQPVRVRFEISNLSDRTIRTTPLATNRNRIVITDPDGKTIEHFVWKDGITPVEVSAGGSFAWEIDINRVFEVRKLTKSGFYKIYWYVDGFKSEAIYLVKSDPGDL